MHHVHTIAAHHSLSASVNRIKLDKRCAERNVCPYVVHRMPVRFCGSVLITCYEVYSAV
jgi:hypothetical protein